MFRNDLLKIWLLKSKEMFKNNFNNKIKIKIKIKIFMNSWKKTIIN